MRRLCRTCPYMGSDRKKWRFFMWDWMLGSPKYQKSVFLLRRVLDDYPIKYKGRSKKEELIQELLKFGIFKNIINNYMSFRS